MLDTCQPLDARPPSPSLRVVVVTETYPPEINGVAMTVARVVDGLRVNGHEVQLVRPRRDSRETARSEAGYSEILSVGVVIPRYRELKFGLPMARRLERAWRDRRPDVVHIATEGPLGSSALKAARRLGVPVVSEFRTNFHAYSTHYGIGFLRNVILGYLRKFHNQTAVTMVPTARLGRELEAEGFERVQVVARGVDVSLFDPMRRDDALRASWGAGPDTLVAAAVGRIAAEKNLLLMGRAFERMKAVRPNTKLVMVGDGPARASFEKTAPDAIFAGKRFGEDLARHYASADVLLFPSATETFGNATLEAMASGLAVIAFNYGAAGEFIRSDENGWAVPLEDAGAYLRAAEKAAGDLASVRRVGARARTEVRSCGWDRILEQIERQYRNVMTSRGTVRNNPFRSCFPMFRSSGRGNGGASLVPFRQAAGNGRSTGWRKPFMDVVRNWARSMLDKAA